MSPDEVTVRTRAREARAQVTVPGPTPEEIVDAVVGMTPAAASVICRWHPEGAAQLRALAGNSAGSSPTSGETSSASGNVGAVTVAVCGPDDANTRLLCAELQRFHPALVFVGSQRPAAQSPARVAVVLVDPGAPVGAATVDMVAGVQAAGLPLVFVANGIHACEDWPAVASRHSDVLARVLGEAPEIVGVSTRLACAARREGNPELAEQAGLRLLHRRMVAAAAQGLAEQVIEATRRRIRDEAATLRADATVPDLRAQRARLLAGRDGGRAEALAALRNAVSLVRLDLLHEVGARVRTSHASARTELIRLNRAALRVYPEQLRQQATQLSDELTALAGHRLSQLAARFEVSVGHDDRVGDPPDLGPDPDLRRRGVDDHLTVALGASAGFGLGRLLAAPLALLPGLDYATALIALVLGGGMAYWMVRVRARLAVRAVLQQWVADALAAVKAQLEQQVATAVMVTESRASEVILRGSAARVVETDRRVAELSTQLRRVQTQQAAQLAACDRDLTLLEFRTDPSGRPAIDQHYTLGTGIPAGVPL